MWSFQTGGYIYGSPALVGNLLIIGSADHNLYALDKSTGKQVWKSNLGERVVSKPLMESDSIYIGNSRGEFFCLNLKDGKTKWKIETGRDVIHYNPCMDRDSVCFGSYDNNFYKVSKTGQRIWSWQGTSDF
ncbi:MAG TPA: PQQ-binding-like beta-propeller repeat protein, partial [Acidobacteriota bacterium]|nr:PQQ-binding-like beta-propeller repeat protein [Acidobacteriota bacterium]